MTFMLLSRLLPTPEDVLIAGESGRVLSAYLQAEASTQRIEIVDGKGGVHPVRMPVGVLRLLVEWLMEMGEGNAVCMISLDEKGLENLVVRVS